RPVTFDAHVYFVHRVGHALFEDFVSHAEGVAAGLPERRIGCSHRLHVTAHTDIGNGGAVRAAGNHLAIGISIDALDHVARRAVMHAETRTASPRRQTEFVVRDVLVDFTVPAVMTSHAKRAKAGV